LPGSSGFIEQIKTKYFATKTHKDVPQSKYLEPTIEDIRRTVSKVYKVPEACLIKLRRGFYNEARDVAVYLSRLMTGKKLVEIGAAFDIANYSTVSSVIVNMRDRSKADRVLAKKLKLIELGIKGQRQT